jgi:hypothetical protein
MCFAERDRRCTGGRDDEGRGSLVETNHRSDAYKTAFQRPQHMIDFDEDLVGDVSVRPNAALLTSYGRHAKIPSERGGKQPARTGHEDR